MGVDWRDFVEPDHTLEVIGCSPYPTSRAYRDGAGERHEDDRLHWLTLSLKRGQKWKGMAGDLEDPAAVIASRANVPPAGLAAAFVPVPRSSKTQEPIQASTWPALAIVEALPVRCAIALHRVQAVNESSRGSSFDRTTIAAHQASLGLVVPVGELPATVVLVDDVITSGTQLAACVEVLRANGFAGHIRGFTASYAIGSADEARRWNAPLRVEWSDGDSWARRAND